MVSKTMRSAVALLGRHGVAVLVILLAHGCGAVIDSDETLQARPRGGAGGGDDLSTEDASFSGDVLPILVEYCGNCHGASDAAGGISLSSYDAVMTQVQPGNAQASAAYSTIVQGAMPPVGLPTPSDIERALIRSWIDAGAPNN